MWYCRATYDRAPATRHATASASVTLAGMFTVIMHNYFSGPCAYLPKKYDGATKCSASPPSASHGNSPATRSPTRTFLTSDPAASTTPATSKPSTVGAVDP